MIKSLVRAFAIAPFILGGIAGCSASAEEEEPTGESQDRLLAGRRLSQAEIADLVREAGFPERLVGTMVCTAKYESSFYEGATNRNRNGTTDRGLFQINSIHVGSMRGCPSTSSALMNAEANVRCAYAIYRAQGLNAWYGYRKHRTECNNYPAPARGSSSGADEPGGCWSGTLEDTVDARTCVQSKFDGEWYQCMNGKWYEGVTASRSGPYGVCSATYPIP